MSNTSSVDRHCIDWVHGEAQESLYALVRLYNLVPELAELSAGQVNVFNLKSLYQDYLAPMFQPQGRLAANPTEAELAFSRFTSARLKMHREVLVLNGTPAANAHAIALGVPIWFARSWNRCVQPNAIEADLPFSAGALLALALPQSTMDLRPFLAVAIQLFKIIDPMSLPAELEFEYTLASETIEHERRTVVDGSISGSSDIQTARVDGLEGGRWLIWKNKQHKIPQGTIYRLLAFMWDRNSAGYESLNGDVFDSEVSSATIRSYANKANNALPPGFPWRLSTDAVNRYLTKILTATAAKKRVKRNP
jgi:hypothetical protein